MKKRLEMAFDGWASQFENPPAWRPELKIVENHVFIDDQLLGIPSSDCSAIEIQVGHIIVYGEKCADTKTIVIEWPYNEEPFIKEII